MGQIWLLRGDSGASEASRRKPDNRSRESDAKKSRTAFPYPLSQTFREFLRHLLIPGLPEQGKHVFLIALDARLVKGIDP